MAILTVSYFFPCSIMMYNAYQKLKESGLQPMDNVVAIFSFGAFISNIDEHSLQFYKFEDRQN